MLYIEPKADLAYGASGTGKTTQIGKVLEYVIEHTGKIGRLVTADPGGYGPLMALVKAGLLEVWVLTNWPYAIETIDRACQGYWPEDPANPKSKLIAPTADTWKRVGFQGYEGLTSFGDAILRRLRDTRAKISQDPSYVWSDSTNEAGGTENRQGAISYSGGNQSYYGFTQDRLYEFVVKSHLLPTVKTLWTALEARGEEEGTKIPLFGPAIAGKKSIGKATQWFCNSVHLESVIIGEKVNPETKQTELTSKTFMYLKTHADPSTKISFPCKTREVYQMAGELPVSMEPDMGLLYKKIDELEVRGSKLLEDKLARFKQMIVQPAEAVKEAMGLTQPAVVAITQPAQSIAEAKKPTITISGASAAPATLPKQQA